MTFFNFAYSLCGDVWRGKKSKEEGEMRWGTLIFPIYVLGQGSNFEVETKVCWGGRNEVWAG